MPDDKKNADDTKYSKLIKKTSEDEPQGFMYAFRALPALSESDKQNMLNLLRQASGVTGLSILTLALVASIVLVQQNQDLRSKAKELPVTPTATPTFTPTPTPQSENSELQNGLEEDTILPEDVPQPQL